VLELLQASGGEVTEPPANNLLRKSFFSDEFLQLTADFVSAITASSLPDLLKAGDYTPFLYHYTSAKGLHGIIKDHCLHASAAYCMNDASEIEYGRGVLEEVLIEITVRPTRKEQGEVSVVA
jgi:hypothetical protein